MSEMGGSITLTMDGQLVSARAGQTLLSVARDHRIDIPTLCHLDGLEELGGCRLCVVEVAGARKPLPACVTTASEGMVVRSQTPRIREYRRQIVELLFSARKHICSVCVSNGHCELQALTLRLGITHVRYPNLNVHHRIDASHERYAQDGNRCILCGRCERVCAQVEHAHIWGMAGRGIHADVVTDLGEPWGESEGCTRCGKCVHVCPTGALVERGISVAEMAKRRQMLPYLEMMREEDRLDSAG